MPGFLFQLGYLEYPPARLTPVVNDMIYSRPTRSLANQYRVQSTATPYTWYTWYTLQG